MIYVIKGLVKGKPMLALMTATADKVEHYNLIEDHIQYYAHYAQASISTLATQ